MAGNPATVAACHPPDVPFRARSTHRWSYGLRISQPGVGDRAGLAQVHPGSQFLRCAADDDRLRGSLDVNCAAACNGVILRLSSACARNNHQQHHPDLRLHFDGYWTPPHRLPRSFRT
jgi:hypothetical protein